MKYPESLVAWVFKARYHPKPNFLEAKLGCNPSFIWRNKLNMRVATPVPEQLEGKMVKHLMCTGRREWDKGAVRDILDERDAELVTCHRECRDTLYWAEDHRGRTTADL
nr:uncharacterized protein LOC109164714 [Ipomoea batatas]